MTEIDAAAAFPRAKRLLGTVAGLVAIAIWAGWIVWTEKRVASGAGPGFAAFDIALLRFGPPAALLAPFWLRPLLRRRGAPAARAFAASWKPPQTRWPLLLMMLGWGAPFVLLASHGLTIGGPPLMAAMIPGAAPLYAALIAALFFGLRPRGAALVALILIAGAAVISLMAAPAEQAPAAIWFAGAAIGWAGYIVAFPRSGLAPLQAVGLLSAWSTALLLLSAPFLSSNLFEIELDAVLTEFVVQGVVSGALSIIAYTIALDLAPPLLAVCLPACVPVVAAVFSAVFGGAPPSVGQAIGLGVATAGLVVLGVSSLRARRVAAGP